MPDRRLRLLNEVDTLKSLPELAILGDLYLLLLRSDLEDAILGDALLKDGVERCVIGALAEHDKLESNISLSRSSISLQLVQCSKKDMCPCHLI